LNKTAILFNLARFEDALGAIDEVIALDANEPSHHETRAQILGRLETCDNWDGRPGHTKTHAMEGL